MDYYHNQIISIIVIYIETMQIAYLSWFLWFKNIMVACQAIVFRVEDYKDLSVPLPAVIQVSIAMI